MRHLNRALVFSFFIATFNMGCAGLKTRTDLQAPDIDVTEEIDKGDESVYHPSPEFGRIELEVNPAVQKWLNYFTGRGRPHMNRYLRRSSRYLPLMKEILRKKGLPEELVYVPLIESGFNSTAYSHASAVGYWQFIRGTGSRYGLVISKYVDERQDPYLSTEAGAEYFSALFSLFGDWHLALAAYNTGENRVKRAVMRYGTRNFWQLAKKRRLYRETRNYVPKYIAAALIHQSPEKYGFTKISYEEPLSYDSVDVTKPISLVKLAKEMGVEYKELKKLNPLYRSDYVPIYKGKSVQIRVPKGRAIAAVASLEKSYSNKPLKALQAGHFYYRVRRGDTLSEIAHRYRTRVSTLRRLNRLGRRSLIRVGQRIKVPERYRRNARPRSVAQRSAKPSISKKGPYHKVRRGENLILIAKKYGTTVSELRRLNRLGRRSLIRTGQRLYLPSDSSKEGSSRSREAVSDRVYVVRRGDNLSTIASRHGISLSQLRRRNGLGRRSVIRPGQVLVINGRKKIHVVRRGENLSVIAKKYQTTVRRLASANSIRKRSRIYVGAKLVIPH